MTQRPLRQAEDRPFKQVDVFTGVPYRGNPLAVVLDGSGLSDEEMQHFAQWTHLSETTFLLPPTEPGADYRVRIFTPGGELPFAGHPTLGSCHAWLENGGMNWGSEPKFDNDIARRQQPRAELGSDPPFIVQECKQGLVRIRADGKRLAFAAPPMKRSAPSPAVLAQVASALGLTAQQVVTAQLLDNGPVWLGLLLDSAQTVLNLSPNHMELKNLGQKVGVAGVHRTSSAANSIANPLLEVRAFAAPIGITEDPVTGSLNASLAQWLIEEGHLPPAYVAAQGSCLQRAGRVHITRDDPSTGSGQVWVGGESVTCITGTVAL